MSFNDKQFSVYNGNKIEVEIFGASHAPEIGVKVKGFEGQTADFEILKNFMVRRRAKQTSYSTKRLETDEVIIEKGFDGKVFDDDFSIVVDTCDGVEVKLTKKEFELLAYLISHRGKICSREQILNRVWSDEVVVLDRTIDVNITRVRSKIGAYGSYIVTRSGFGYGFRD